MSQAFINVEGLTRRFPNAAGGGELTVFEDLWFTEEEGEFACMIGHSGCGKSTILNVLAGLANPPRGNITAPRTHLAAAGLPRPRTFHGPPPAPPPSALRHDRPPLSPR